MRTPNVLFIGGPIDGRREVFGDPPPAWIAAETTGRGGVEPINITKHQYRCFQLGATPDGFPLCVYVHPDVNDWISRLMSHYPQETHNG